MKERPIIFSGESVRATFEKRKTQTRRVIRSPGNQWHINRLLGEWSLSEDPVRWENVRDTADSFYPWRPTKAPGDGDWLWTIQTDVDDTACHVFKYPYGRPGDVLRVKEAWRAGEEWDEYPPSEIEPGSAIWYEADGWCSVGSDDWGRLRSPLYIPKWACRLRPPVLDVRVERLQTITLEDCLAEGISIDGCQLPRSTPGLHDLLTAAARKTYAAHWDALNAKRGFGWEINPWVWCVTYEPIDSV